MAQAIPYLDAGGDTDLVTKETDKSFPYDMPDQHVVIFNVAHTGQKVVSEKPSIRVLGVVRDVDAALAALEGVPIDAPVFMCEAKKFTLLSRSPEPDDGPDRIRSMLERVEREFLETRQRFNDRLKPQVEKQSKMVAEFENAGRKKDDGAEEEAEEAQTTEAAEAAVVAAAAAAAAPEEGVGEEGGEGDGEAVGTSSPFMPPSDIPTVKRWSRDSEVRNQQFCAISVIEDDQPDRNEPAVCVYAAFDSEHDCDAYVQNTVSKQVREFEVYTVQMYEWLSMEDMRKVTNETYRHTKVNNVMKGLKSNQEKVDAYKQSCADDETGPNIIDLTVDGEGEGEGGEAGGMESKE